MCVENVVFTTLRINVRVGRQKKKKKKKKKKRQKVIHLSEAVSLPCQMNYIFTKGNIPTQIRFIIVHNIFTPETTRRSAVRN